MSTPAAVFLACCAVAFAAWFALTRNGHRLLYVTLVAVHRLLVPESGERGLNEPAGVRKVLREIVLSALWQARNLAGQPRLWRIERAIRVRGCLPGSLPDEVRHPDAEEAPAPDHPGRALASTDAAGGASPYPAHTAPQPVLGLEPVSAARPFVLAEECLPDVIA